MNKYVYYYLDFVLCTSGWWWKEFKTNFYSERFREHSLLVNDQTKLWTINSKIVWRKNYKKWNQILKSSPPKIKIVLRTNYLPGGLVSCTSLVKLTLGVAGWWNSDLLFMITLASELWINLNSFEGKPVNDFCEASDRFKVEVVDVSNLVWVVKLQVFC